MTIRLLKSQRISGKLVAAGTVLTGLDKDVEARAMEGGGAARFTDLSVGLTLLATLLSTVVPEIGPLPTWATNAGATGVPSIVDYLGNVRYCKTNEARFWGARRVENLLRASNGFDNATYWTQVNGPVATPITTDASDTVDVDGSSYRKAYLLTGDGTTSKGEYQTLGVLPAGKYTFSIEVKAGDVGVGLGAQMYVSGGATAKAITYTPVAGADWLRIGFTGVADGVSSYRILLRTTAVGSVKIRKGQFEDKTTEADDANGNRPPFEYVGQDEIVYSTGQIAPYHGSFVDGVKYFQTTCANTLNNATNVVSEQAGVALPLSQLLGLWGEEQDTNLCTNGDTLTGWTINGGGTPTLSVTTGQPSPDGRNNAVLLTEDTNFTSKFAYLACAFADNSQSCAFTVFEQPPTNAARYGRIGIKKKDGTTVIGSFDVQNGGLANESAVLAAGARSYMVRLGNTNRWLCALTAPVGAGGGVPECHFGIMSTPTGSTYTGDGKSLRMWNPHFIAKEHPCTPIKPAATAQTRTGYAIDYGMGQVIGRNDFAIHLEMHPMFDTGATGKTQDGVTMSWYYPWCMRAAVPDMAYYRCAQSIRPFVDPVLGHAIFAGDRYNGNAVQAYKWRPNTLYTKGAWVVPTATKADNATPSQKQYYNWQAGVSGALEPNWNTNWVSPPDGGVANVTLDGDCRWQAWHQNRIGGEHENYDGFLTLTRSGFMQPCRIVNWFSGAPTDMGAAINGVLGYRQTEPFPINPAAPDGSFLKAMDHLRLGRASTTWMASSQGFRLLAVWNDPTDNNAEAWVQLSANGGLV